MVGMMYGGDDVFISNFQLTYIITILGQFFFYF